MNTVAPKYICNSYFIRFNIKTDKNLNEIFKCVV